MEHDKSILEPEWWAPKTDEDSESSVRFKIRALNALEMLEVMTLGKVSANSIFTTSHAGKMYLLRRGVVDWDGIDEPYSLDALSTHISAEIVIELAQAVFTKSTYADEFKRAYFTRSKSTDTPDAA